MCCTCRQYACPLLPPEQRPPKSKGRKWDGLNGTLNHFSGSEEAPTENTIPGLITTGPFSGTDLSSDTTSASHQTTAQLLPLATSIVTEQGDNEESCDSEPDSPASSSDESDSDNSIKSESLEGLKKPKGLIDGLSKFFTPGNKRKTRVSETNKNANQTLSEAFKKAARKKPKSKCAKIKHSSSQDIAYKLVKKSRMLQAGIGDTRTKNTGQGQLKGLFDGLSHLFTAQGERKKPIPLYVEPKRQRRPSGVEETETTANSPDKNIKYQLEAGKLESIERIVSEKMNRDPEIPQIIIPPVPDALAGLGLERRTLLGLKLPPPVWRRSGYALKHRKCRSHKHGRRRNRDHMTGAGRGGRGRGSAKGKRLAMTYRNLRSGACGWLVVSLLDTLLYFSFFLKNMF